ncbi:MAG TPA: tetratricopeptide repeat protein [Clostridia bacterium]|nr:tetratricopeptide repeat protein [Clostridia bacterium]
MKCPAETTVLGSTSRPPLKNGKVPRLQSVFLGILLALVTFFAFHSVLRLEFVNYDDPEYVTSMPVVQRGLTWEGLKWAWITDHAGNWHPITWLSHMLDAQLFGMRASGHHLVSLLIHVTNVILLFGLLVRQTGTRWRSFLVALLFAVHPLHVESVAWVSERKDVLSALFFLLTLWAYSRFAELRSQAVVGEVALGESNQIASTAPRKEGAPQGLSRSSIFYFLALAFFALGIMSKPMLVTLPFVLLLWDYWPLARLRIGERAVVVRTWLNLLREKVLFLAITLASCVITLIVQHRGGAVQPLATMSITGRIENAVVSFARYLGKTVWPFDLAVPYPHPGHWPLPLVIGSTALLIIIVLTIWQLGRKLPLIATGWLWFFGMMIPVIGIVQVGEQSMADRYTYLPLIGVFIVLVWGGARLASFSRFARPLQSSFAALIVLGCIARTMNQVGHWQNSDTLFRHALRVTDRNWIAAYNLGWSLDHQGKVEEAMAYYRKALEWQPNYDEAWNNLGCALASQKRFAEAIPCFEAALQLKPSDLDPRRNLAAALVELGKHDEAQIQYRLILDRQPTNVEALNGLGNALARRGQFAEAASLFEQSLQLKRDQPATHYNLGNALSKLRRLEQAVAQYQAAVQQKPDYAEAFHDLGITLARMGRMEAAVANLREAVRLAPSDLVMRCNLAKAIASLHKYDEAIKLYQDVLLMDPKNPEAHANLGLTLAIQGEVDQAILHLEKALEYRKEDAIAHFNLGKALAVKNQIEKARFHFSETLRLKPGYEPARQELERLHTPPPP